MKSVFGVPRKKPTMSDLMLSRVGYVFRGVIPCDLIFDQIERLTGKAITSGGEGRFEMQFPRDAEGDFRPFGYICWHSEKTAKSIFANYSSFTQEFEGSSYSVTITPAKFPNAGTTVCNTIQSAGKGSLPKAIGEKELTAYFERYSTGSYFKCKVAMDNGCRRAVVHFDRTTQDAYSALMLCKIAYFDIDGIEYKIFFELQRRR